MPFKHFIGKVSRFLGLVSIFSIIISILFSVLFGSPFENLLKYKINSIKNNFVNINNEIDSLQNKLHSQYFISDNYYREILELDSLPNQIRLAGIGGAKLPVKLESYPYNELINSTSQRLKAIEKQIEIQESSYNKIFKEAVIYNKELSTIPAIQPIKPLKHIWISSHFGYRSDPFTKRLRRHNGIDFVSYANTEIYATADGKVTLTKVSSRGYGKEIIISHNFEYSTCYGHLNKILVKEGQEIKRGQLIGLMGSTGRSTGTHLHYEVRKGKRAINPIYFYSDDLTIKEYEMIVELSVADKNIKE